MVRTIIVRDLCLNVLVQLKVLLSNCWIVQELSLVLPLLIAQKVLALCVKWPYQLESIKSPCSKRQDTKLLKQQTTLQFQSTQKKQ